MRKVYKYTLKEVVNKFEMPLSSRIVHLGMKDDVPSMWAEVNTTLRPKIRTFEVFMTGQSIPDGLHYVGTIFDGPLVVHVYERMGH